jgi:RNA polymerase sigma factor (TIGR02999 family)
MNGAGRVTQILTAIEQGDAEAVNVLLPIVYEELRLLAAQRLSRERPGQTLQATALVHEAYLRLVQGEPQNWSGRGHFFAAAAEAMRRILVENARRKRRMKRGGDRRRMDLFDEDLAVEAPPDELIALDEALNQLAQIDQTKAELVKLRFFAGLTMEEAAGLLEIPLTTAKRHWSYARAWLYGRIRSGD